LLLSPLLRSFSSFLLASFVAGAWRSGLTIPRCCTHLHSRPPLSQILCSLARRCHAPARVITLLAALPRSSSHCDALPTIVTLTYFSVMRGCGKLVGKRCTCALLPGQTVVRAPLSSWYGDSSSLKLEQLIKRSLVEVPTTLCSLSATPTAPSLSDRLSWPPSTSAPPQAPSHSSHYPRCLC
jgi:hypothetical protein